MTAIDFPNTPVNGQVFAAGELTWTYSTGVGWLLNSSTGGGGTDEVWIGATEPSDSALELWYDTDDTSAQQGGLPWNSAWGVVGSDVKTDAATGIAGGAYVDISTVTFTAVAGRRYRAITHLTTVGSTNVDLCIVRIRDSANVSYAGSQSRIDVASGQIGMIAATAPMTFPAGPVTLKNSIYFSQGAGTLSSTTDQPTSLVVEDVGPVARDSGPVTSPTMQWNSAWGVIAYGNATANQAIAGNVWTDIAGLSASFTPVAGRNYKVTAYFGGVNTANSGVMQGRILNGAAQAFTEATLQLPLANWAEQMRLQFFIAATALGGPTTFKAAAQGNMGAGWSTHNIAGSNFIMVEDVGPTSYSTPIADPFPVWITLPFAQNWAGQGTSAPAYRKIGDIGYLQGAVQWGGGTLGDGTWQVCTLPVGYRPAQTRRFVCWLNNTGVPKRVSIDTNGSVTIDTPLTNGHSWELAMFWPVTS